MTVFRSLWWFFDRYFFHSFERVPSFLSRTQWGIVVRLIYVAISACVYAVAAHGLRDVPPVQYLFLRSIGMFALIMPSVLYNFRASVKTHAFSVHFLANATNALSAILWYTLLTMVSMSMLTSLGFLSPILAMLAAFIFLREKYTHYLLMGALLAFVGAEVVVSGAWNQVSIFIFALIFLQIIFSAAFSFYNRRALTKDSPSVSMFYHSLLACFFFAPFAYYYWAPLSLEQWFLILIFFVMNFFMFRTTYVSLHMAPLSVVVPFDFSILIFAGFLDLVFLGILPSFSLWIGGGLIFIGMLFTIFHQRRISTSKSMTADVILEEALNTSDGRFSSKL